MKDKIPSYTDKYFTLKEFLGAKCFEYLKNNLGSERLSKLNDELEVVLQIIEKDPKREEKQKSLKKKLKSKFYDTLPEIEWAAYFGNKHLPVIIEPCFPGPDLKVKVKDRWINIEITNRRLSKEMQELDGYSKDINSGIEKIKSHFSIAVAFRASFSKEDLFPLIKTIKKRIGDFEKKRILKPVTTYYISLNNSKDWYDFDGINEPKDLYTNPKKYPLFDVMRTAKAKIMFHSRDNLDYQIPTFQFQIPAPVVCNFAHLP